MALNTQFKWVIGLTVFYLATHLLFLTKLPIFADESIYLRWAQVAFHVPEKYTFLPLLDGKPPLHVWMLIPFERLLPDPLFAGRLLSVLAGLASVFVMIALVRELGGKKKAQVWVVVLTMFLPFWFFHTRMALAEALLALCFVLGIWSGICYLRRGRPRDIVVFCLSFAAALWMKTSALFFVLPFLLLPTFVQKKYFTKRTIGLGVAGMVGLGLFGLLAFHPLFSALFTRSADYSFSLAQLLSGAWKEVFFQSTPRIFGWLIWYLSPFALLAIAKSGRKGMMLLIMALLYSFPIILFGKVVYSRYFLPAAVPLTLAAALGLAELGRHKPTLRNLLALGIAMQAGFFMFTSYFNLRLLPLPIEDRRQYLSEWSAGFGTREAWQFLRTRAEQTSAQILVASEGYFGSLPDGLQVYADRDPLASQVEIQGIGQPTYIIPDWVLLRARRQETYLLVNADRFFVQDTALYTQERSYPRPFGSPLLLLRITAQ